MLSSLMIILLLLPAIILTGCSRIPRPDNRQPNILLIVTDAARADHFSCYGYGRETTPNIDRVADEGLRFTQAVSSSSWTLPSHASLFTGLLPSENGTHVQHNRLIERIPPPTPPPPPWPRSSRTGLSDDWIQQQSPG